MSESKYVVEHIKSLHRKHGINVVNDCEIFHRYQWAPEILEAVYSLGADVDRPCRITGNTPLDFACSQTVECTIAEWFLARGARPYGPFQLYVLKWREPTERGIRANLAGFGLNPFFKRGVHLGYPVFKRKTSDIWTNLPTWIRDIYRPLEALLVMCAPLTLPRLGKPHWNLDILRAVRQFLRV